MLLLRNRVNSRSVCEKVRVRCFSNDTDVVERKRVIFSGIQPTGVPHLGNYLGALKRLVDFQNEPGDIFYSVVDLHALTVKNEDKTEDRSLVTAACLLACGIDPKRSIIFIQSGVLEHGMLQWALSCLVKQNTMENLTQWKEKSKINQNAANLGLFSYPILQSADILLYKATDVLVGQDQRQHLKLCQNVARSFNYRFGEFFPIPKYVEDPNCTGILSLRDPYSKMSKSEFGKINLTDSNDDIWNKIKRAITDNISEVTFDPIRRPGVSNLVQIHSSITGLPIEDICSRAQNEGLNTGQYKMAVAEAVIDHLGPIRTEYERIMDDRAYLEGILVAGEERAREAASKNWQDIAELLGL